MREINILIAAFLCRFSLCLTKLRFLFQIQKGYNKAASVFVDDCLSAMRGLDVDSPLFRSKIQIKQCTILSGMGKYEEALNNCDAAVELR